MLEKELKYYEEHKDEFIKNYEGKYVLIKDDRLINSFTKMEEAFEEGTRLFGSASFLIKKISKEERVESLPALALGLINADL